MAELEVLVSTLDQATSQDPDVMKRAEEQLKQWEGQPSFYLALLNVCFNKPLPTHVRWIAILYYKNGVDKFWRRAVHRVFTEEDKNSMKQMLLSSFSESISQIAVQIAVVIGRVARVDLRTWPDLIPKLLQNVRSTDATVQYNAILIMNHVVKGLVSKRLASDRRTFKEISSGLFSFILELWIFHSNSYVSHLSAEQISEAEKSLKMSVLTLKVLRKLIVEGSGDLIEDSTEVRLIQILVEKMPMLIDLRTQYVETPGIGERLQKLIVNGMKILLETQDRHPTLFIAVLEKSLNMTMNYVFHCDQQGSLFEMFIVQCANLIRSVTKCKSYKIQKETPVGKYEALGLNAQTYQARCVLLRPRALYFPVQHKTENIADQYLIKANQIKQTIFTQENVAQLCNILILKYFPLKTQDLEEWEIDPENYVAEEVGDSDKYLLRPCTECLFLCLYYEYRPIFTDALSKLVQSLNVAYNADDSNALLMREAVYFALGLASYELFGDLDFDHYFRDFLVNELQDSSPRMRIIHRRILWLIGRWINVSFSKESRVMLYQILIKMMDKKEDLVVRVTASQTLKDAVDEYQFESKDISPYLKDLWEKLFHLLIDVQQCDTKMKIMCVISVLIERVGTEIRPFASDLCEYIPYLWKDSNEHNMLRCMVVTTLTHLVKALSVDSCKLHPLLLPIIQLCTDLKQPSHVYLIDDGLELWLTFLQNSSTMTEDLLHLFGVLPVLLEQVSENFKVCIAIIESYIILDAVSVVQVYSERLVGIVESLIGEMKEEGNKLLAKLVRVTFQSLPNDGPIMFEPVMVKLFKVIRENQEYATVVTSYLSLFGYVILNNSAAFSSIIRKTCVDINAQADVLAAQFLDVWLEKVDCMSDDNSRKLTAMALVSLLPSNASFVNERFPLILDTTVNVLHSLAKDDSELSSNASLKRTETTHDETEDDGSFAMEEQRKQKLQSVDPVYTTSLVDFLKSKMAESRAVLGDPTFQSLMRTMDPVVAQQLMSLIL